MTAITKQRFFPNLQTVRVVLPNGQVKRIRVAASVIKKGQITKGSGSALGPEGGLRRLGWVAVVRRSASMPTDA